MRIIVIAGSRNPEGQTARASSAFLEGVKSTGATGEVVYLPELDIQRCRQCRNDGWGDCTSSGKCVIEDRFGCIVEEIRAADKVVFATPVYFSDLSESLRAFLDRLRRICRHDSGKTGIAGKPAVGICVAGGGGGGAPRCCRNMEWILQTTGFDVVDLIPVRRQNLESKFEALSLAGRHFAST